LLVLAWFRGLGVGCFQLLYTIYLTDLGYTMTGIGLAITAASAFSAIIGPGFGAVLDVLGPRAAVAVTASLHGLALLMLNLKDYSILLLAYALHFTGFMLGQPARMTMLYRSVPLDRLAWFVSLLMLTFGAARVAGTLVAGYQAATIGYEATFTSIGVLVLLGVAAFHLITTGTAKASRYSLLRAVAEAYLHAVRPSRSVAAMYVVVALDRIGWSLWFPLVSAMLYRVGYSVEEVSTMMALMSLVQTLASPLAGRLADRLDPRLVLAVSEALGILGIAMLARGLPLEALLMVGLSIATWVPSYNKLVAIHAGERPGEMYATMNTVRLGASTVSPYVGGLIYDLVGVQATLAASAALLAASALTVLSVKPLRGESRLNVYSE
jgi:MFS family permease